MKRADAEGDAPRRLAGGGEPREAFREALGWPLVLYFFAIVLVVTLSPFDFSRPHRPRVNLNFYAGDLLSNILLFVPLGFLFRLGVDRSNWAWRTAAFSFAVSAGIEFLQLFLPLRVTSPQDVAANVAGSWIGAAACDALAARLHAQGVRMLVLEMPLAAIFYLMAPLSWLNSLLAMEHLARTPRIWATVPLGTAAGLIVGSIARRRLGPTGIHSHWGVVVVVVVWMATSNAINFLHDARTTLAACLGTGAIVAVILQFPDAAFGRSRRFEQAVLLRVLPLFVVYLVAASLLPFAPLQNQWSWTSGFDALSAKPKRPSIAAALDVVEQWVQYAILGAVVAGLRGRKGESRASMLLWVGATCGLIAAACEGLRGFHPAHSAGLGEWAVAAAASVYGAYLYRMHLRAVRRILGRPPPG
jgi:VanZ family protein